MSQPSQLHCPATFVVVRHAEAAYEQTVLTRDGGWLTPPGGPRPWPLPTH